MAKQKWAPQSWLAETWEPATTQVMDVPSLLDQVILATKTQDSNDTERSKDSFKQFLESVVAPGQVVSKDVKTNIKYWIGQIDRKLSAQLNEILHHPAFQKLEGTWRGLHYLVNQSETGEQLKVRVLNVKKEELFKDLQKAVEFDQSTVFKKVYEEEYGTLGGTPYGVLIGDYEFGRGAEDVQLLKMMSGVAASAHAPFITNASPKMFNLDSFTELANVRDLNKVFDSVEYVSWKSFRDSEDSRYVGLTLPRVLARLPCEANSKGGMKFNFEERVDGRDASKYAWMGAAWAYGTRITDAYNRDGWFARTRGLDGGGMVKGLPAHAFPTDHGVVVKSCTEIALTDRRDFELSHLGFLPLIHAKDKDFPVFMGTQSCQKPKTYMDPVVTANAELSAKLNYLMCVSRFAHYLKVMARDKIGSHLQAQECERWLHEWISHYCCDPHLAGEETKAHKPLSEARIEVREIKGKPGWYEAVAWLLPHFQLETLTTAMRLVAEVPRKG